MTRRGQREFLTTGLLMTDWQAKDHILSKSQTGGERCLRAMHPVWGLKVDWRKCVELEQGWTPGVGEVAARYDIYTMEEVSVI